MEITDAACFHSALEPAARAEQPTADKSGISLGIEFVSLHEGVDTSTPNGRLGRLIFGIFGSIAEFERELIRERVRSGIAVTRAQGKRIGRPSRHVDAGRVRELRALDRSWAQIAKQLGAGLGTYTGKVNELYWGLASTGTAPRDWEFPQRRQPA